MVIVVERRKDGKMHPPGGYLPDADRDRARLLAHYLVRRDRRSLRQAQKIMFEDHGIRRSLGSIHHDLRTFECPECAG